MSLTVYIIQSIPVCFSISAKALCINASAFLMPLQPVIHYKDDGCCFYFDYLSADLAMAQLKKQIPTNYYFLIGMVVEDTDCFEMLREKEKELTV